MSRHERPEPRSRTEAVPSVNRVSSLTEDFGSVEYLVSCVGGRGGSIKGESIPLLVDCKDKWRASENNLSSSHLRSHRKWVSTRFPENSETGVAPSLFNPRYHIWQVLMHAAWQGGITGGYYFYHPGWGPGMSEIRTTKIGLEPWVWNPHEGLPPYCMCGPLSGYRLLLRTAL